MATFSPAAATAYARVELDRAGRRQDSRWVAELAQAPGTVFLLFRGGECLLDEAGGPLRLAAPTTVSEVADEVVLLGLGATGAVFAADLSTTSVAEALRLSGASRTASVRELYLGLSESEAAEVACAKGLLHWHRQQRFCGVCGTATESAQGGAVRRCTGEGCGKLHFPRIEPAVIVLVEACEPDRCLLARHVGAPEDSFSLLAGFAEIGEGLEGAVAREVLEEAGVEIDSLSYRGSQGWPFPSGLMVAFRARAVSERIAVDRRELVEARWFTREQLRQRVEDGHGLGPADSIGHRLLEDWLRG